jgi:hypothetical protein
MIDVIQLVPYSQRKQKMEGHCSRCNKEDVRVIESIEGGMICWDLGACQMRHPFPKAPAWDRSMAEII